MSGIQYSQFDEGLPRYRSHKCLIGGMARQTARDMSVGTLVRGALERLRDEYLRDMISRKLFRDLTTGDFDE